MQVVKNQESVPERLERLYARALKRASQTGTQNDYPLKDMDMTVIRSGPFTICELFYIPTKKRGYGLATRSYTDHENHEAGEAISFVRAAEDLLRKLQ